MLVGPIHDLCGRIRDSDAELGRFSSALQLDAQIPIALSGKISKVRYLVGMLETKW